jgi:hypothetical protein
VFFDDSQLVLLFSSKSQSALVFYGKSQSALVFSGKFQPVCFSWILLFASEISVVSDNLLAGLEVSIPVLAGRYFHSVLTGAGWFYSFFAGFSCFLADTGLFRLVQTFFCHFCSAFSRFSLIFGRSTDISAGLD